MAQVVGASWKFPTSCPSCEISKRCARRENPFRMGQNRMPQDGVLEAVKRIPGALEIRYDAGELLFQAGAFAAGVYVVEDGLVVRGFYREGNATPAFLAAPGDLVGVEAWMAEPAPRYRGFARALTPTRVWFVSFQDWAEALACFEFQKLLLDRLARALLNREVLRSLVGEPERALAWLLWHWGEPKSGRLRLPANASLLASLIGCSRNAVGRALEILLQEGAVELESGWVVSFPEALRAYFSEEAVTASLRG